MANALRGFSQTGIEIVKALEKKLHREKKKWRLARKKNGACQERSVYHWLEAEMTGEAAWEVARIQDAGRRAAR